MVLEKLSKEELVEALHKHLMHCSEKEIKFVFHIFGFDLKECHLNEDFGIDFEVHYKRIFIARIINSVSNILSFENEYVNFGEGTHGISMGQTETLAETIVVFINMFAPNLLQEAHYEVSYNPETSLFASVEEAQEYLQAIQEEAQKIIGKNHPEPVPAPGQKQETAE